MHTDFGYFEEDALGRPYDVKLLRRLYPYTKPYRKLLFGSILLVVLITLLDLAMPYVTKIAIDQYIVPVKYTTSADDGEQPGEKTRFYWVDLKDPEIKMILNNIPGFFRPKELFQALNSVTSTRLNPETFPSSAIKISAVSQWPPPPF